jgi:hypothetical protein
MPTRNGTADHDRLDRVVAEARRNREAREKTYRDRAQALPGSADAAPARSITAVFSS